ncbi:unnamed protein product [Symbiodinium microadriaticum]|nr:unnamed protein product [Symbiodinium microadriaticum]
MTVRWHKIANPHSQKRAEDDLAIVAFHDPLTRALCMLAPSGDVPVEAPPPGAVEALVFVLSRCGSEPAIFWPVVVGARQEATGQLQSQSSQAAGNEPAQNTSKFENDKRSRGGEVSTVGQDQVHGNFQALLGCLQAVSADPARQKVLRDKGWTTKEGHWNYQRWDAESQALLIDEDKSPVPQQELIGLVAQIAELVLARDVIHRFNATHLISPEKEGTSTFMLGVGLRAQGMETTWNHLERLTNLAALQVIGLQIRGERLHKGGLAKEGCVYLWCYYCMKVPEFQLVGHKIQAWCDILYNNHKPVVVSRLPAWQSILR